MVDESGSVVWAAAYAPFGEARVYVDEVVNNLRFPGQYYDVETGLHYNWHRYYDPGTGRYLTPDPIGLAGGLNLYSYVKNNPINLIDFLGLDYLKFNGSRLSWIESGPFRQDKEKKSWPANSGKTRRGMQIYKPIPDGLYFTSPFRDRVERSSEEESSWGPVSYRLHESSSTRKKNRQNGRDGGFFIHGGNEPGTAGCVEFEDYSMEQEALFEFEKMLQEYGAIIELRVKYD